MYHDKSGFRHTRWDKSKKGGLSFPLLLIVVGLVFLAVNTGWIPTIYKPLLQTWPIWVCFAGLFFLVHRVWFLSVSLLTLGLFYVIPQVGVINPALNIPGNFTHTYWPVLLVVAGVYFILHLILGHKCCLHKKSFCSEMNASSFDTEDGFLRIKSTFDSRKHIVMDPVFKGGYIEVGFGEVVIDLRKTNLAEGKTLLKIQVSFGEAQIIVPAEWNVKVKGESAFGSFDDSRINPSYDPNCDRTLEIEGKCSFGECRIRD
jgi:predicted membrane protein